MGTVFRLTLRQLASRRRLAIVVLLAAIPVGLTVLLNTFLADEEEFTAEFVDNMVNAMLLGIILPIIVMTLATSAFGNELEDRTLNMLVLKPVSRLAIVAPKLVGSIVIAAPVLVASTAAVVLIALGDGGLRAVGAASAALLVGVVTYAAIFTWAGLISKYALAFALVYVFLWEALLTQFLPGLRFVSIRLYAVGIMHGLDDTTFEVLGGDDTLSLTTALAFAGIVTAAFFVLTVRRLRRMDVP